MPASTNPIRRGKTNPIAAAVAQALSLPSRDSLDSGPPRPTQPHRRRPPLSPTPARDRRAKRTQSFPGAKDEPNSCSLTSRWPEVHESRITNHESRLTTLTRAIALTALLFWTTAIAPAQAPSPDRSVAEWVLRKGGSVILAGEQRHIWGLTALPWDAFQLHSINLVDTDFTPEDIQRIGRLPHLKALYASGRFPRPFSLEVKRKKLYDDGPKRDATDGWTFLKDLPNLETLQISATVFSYPIPIDDDAIGHLAKHGTLRELFVSRTAVKGTTLDGLTDLRLLDVSYTSFGDDAMPALAKMPRLSKVNLRDTLVTDQGLSHLAPLRALTELNLEGINITDRGLAHLRNATRLRKLNLLGANVTDEGLAHLRALTQLEELNLYRTFATNSVVESLASLKHLKQVDLRYSRVTRAGVDALRAALPACHVVFMDSSARPGLRSRPVSILEEPDEKAVAEWVRSLGGDVEESGGHVTMVALAGSPVTDAELQNLSSLRHLQALDLSATETSDLGAGHLGGLVQLKELNLADTAVSDSALRELAGLTELRKLSLNNTAVQGDGLEALTSLGQLIDLDLSGVALSDDAARHLAALSGLEQLSLAQTDLTDDGFAHLSRLKNLRSLDLSGSDIGNLGLVHLSKLVRLETLVMRHGRFTDDGLCSLESLQALRELDLTRTRAGDAGLAALARLTNLRRLNLDYTLVSDDGLRHLAALPNLADLQLNSARVSDRGLEQLRTMSQLQRVNLYHTLISEKGLAELQAALPECEIIWDPGSGLPTRRGS